MKRRSFLAAVGAGLVQLALPKPAIAGLLTDGNEIEQDVEPTGTGGKVWRVVTSHYDAMIWAYGVKFSAVRQRVQAR